MKSAISSVSRSGATRSSRIELASSSRPFGQLLGQQAGVGERVHRVAVVADHQRRRRERPPLGAVRRGPLREQALEHGGARRRVLAHGVEQHVGRPRHGALRARGASSRESARITGSPTVSATISGVNATAQASSALSSTGISTTIPRSRSGASDADLERRVRAERRAADDRLVDAEVVEQRDDVLGEEAHAVAPHLRRPVRAAVAEQVERDDAVAALGERARQRACMRWLSSRPCRSTVTRGPSPYSR